MFLYKFNGDKSDDMIDKNDLMNEMNFNIGNNFDVLMNEENLNSGFNGLMSNRDYYGNDFYDSLMHKISLSNIYGLNHCITIEHLEDTKMEKIFYEIKRVIINSNSEEDLNCILHYISGDLEYFYSEIYKKHNYVDILKPYFDIAEEDILEVNYFLYKYTENNDLLDLLFDVYSLSKSIMSGDVEICLKVVEDDFTYENFLGIYIKCFDWDSSSRFYTFKRRLAKRHGYDVLYKTIVYREGCYERV